jgi:hypothetical protein
VFPHPFEIRGVLSLLSLDGKSVLAINRGQSGDVGTTHSTTPHPSCQVTIVPMAAMYGDPTDATSPQTPQGGPHPIKISQRASKR